MPPQNNLHKIIANKKVQKMYLNIYKLKQLIFNIYGSITDIDESS